jgi:hypothetical protein
MGVAILLFCPGCHTRLKFYYVLFYLVSIA